MANQMPPMTYWIDEAEDRPVYCRITKVSQWNRGSTLEGWRERNRLFMRAVANGKEGYHPVPRHASRNQLTRLLDNGALYLLTNGIY